MSDYSWNTGPGAWNTGTNWTPDGPPGSSDFAYIIDGKGGTITGPGTAAYAYFGGLQNGTLTSDSAHWTLTGGTLSLAGYSLGLYEGVALGSLALDVEDALTVTNAVIDTRNGGTVGGIVYIDPGASGTAELAIGTGGTLFAGSPYSEYYPALLTGGGNDTLSAIGGTIDLNGGAFIGLTGTSDLLIGAGGALDVGLDPAGDAYLLIGEGSEYGSAGDSNLLFGQYVAGETATAFAVVASGGTVNSAGGVFVGGYGGDGTLDVGTGGVVNLGTAYGRVALDVGPTLPSTGTVYGGMGTLEIDQGGTVTDASVAPQTARAEALIAPSGTGYVTVNGTGLPPDGALLGSAPPISGPALLDAGMNGIGIALSLGAVGSLTVENGGTALTGSSDSVALAALGVARQGDAVVTVTGTGSALDSDGAVYIGRAGLGTLDVLNGGLLDMTESGGDASVLIGSGGGATAFYTGASGTALVADGGRLTDAADMRVGGGGVTGTLGVDGGIVQIADGLLIASTASIAAGTTVITDAGTTVTAAATVLTAQGTVTVTDGGTLIAGGTILVGTGAGSTGILQVGSMGALVSGADLAIGQSSALGSAGAGTVSVASGGTLAVTSSIEVGSAGTLLLQGGLVDPPSLTFDGGALVGGSGTIDGRLTNDTDVQAGPGQLEIVGAVGGLGGFTILAGSTLALDSTVGPGQSIVVEPGAVFLDADAPDDLAAIGSWQAGDRIDLTDVAYAGATRSYNPATGTLSIVSGGTTYTLSFLDGSSYSLADFVLGNDSTGGVELTYMCFAEGTRLRTMSGPVAVESLRVGHRLPVLLGGGDQPIVWIGRRRVDCMRHPYPDKVWPVRVAYGAFGRGRPAHDLILSPDHAVFFEGVLIPVKYLIDGEAVVQIQVATVTYYHVELLHHDVIEAEGLPVESYLDTGNRLSFEDGGPAMCLHPDFASQRWEAAGCAPLVVTGPELERARMVLRRRGPIRTVTRGRAA